MEGSLATRREGSQIPMQPTTQTGRANLSWPQLTEDDCRELLTHYEMYTLRKCKPYDELSKPTWARAEVILEHVSQKDIKELIRKLDEFEKSFELKRSALFPNQKLQVIHLLDYLSKAELDMNFEWSLAQLDRKERFIRPGVKETEVMTVVVKRSTVKGVNQRAVFEAMEMYKSELTATSSSSTHSHGSGMHITARRDSFHISDVAPISALAPSKPSTEEDCRKALTTHNVYVVSITIKKGELTFDIAKLRIEQEQYLTKNEVKSILQEIRTKTRSLFSLDYRRKPLNSLEDLLVQSFLNHQKENEKDGNFEWIIIKAFKHRKQVPFLDKAELDLGFEEISVQIFAKRVLKEGRSAVDIMQANDRLLMEEVARKREVLIPVMIRPSPDYSMGFGTNLAQFLSHSSLPPVDLRVPQDIIVDAMATGKVRLLGSTKYQNTENDIATAVSEDPNAEEISANAMVSLRSANPIYEDAEESTAHIDLQTLERYTHSQTQYSAQNDSGNLNSWWNWMKNAAAPPAPPPPPGHSRRASRVPLPPPPDIMNIECWLYDDSQAPDYKVSPMLHYWIPGWAASPAPKRSGQEPKAGLKLLHRRISHDLQPFPEVVFARMNKLLSLPPIYEHQMSRKSGFLGRITNVDGKLGMWIFWQLCRVELTIPSVSLQESCKFCHNNSRTLVFP
jgi:hypothetical protein